jgi:hypothetical protein
MPIPLAAWCKECVCGPLVCWDFRVRIPPEGMVVFESVVCCQVEVCVSGVSLVQRSSTDCGASHYDCEVALAPLGPSAPRGGNHGEYYVYLSLWCTLLFCGLLTFSENSRSSKTYLNSITCPDGGPVKLFIYLFLHTAARNSAFTNSATVESDLQNVDSIKISCQERPYQRCHVIKRKGTMQQYFLTLYTCLHS